MADGVTRVSMQDCKASETTGSSVKCEEMQLRVVLMSQPEGELTLHFFNTKPQTSLGDSLAKVLRSCAITPFKMRKQATIDFVHVYLPPLFVTDIER